MVKKIKLNFLAKAIYDNKYKYYNNRSLISKSTDKKNQAKSNDLRRSAEANKLKFSMISEIGNIYTEESPNKKNYNNPNNKSYLYDQNNNEKSKILMQQIDENGNENLKEITMLMRKILEE